LFFITVVVAVVAVVLPLVAVVLVGGVVSAAG
jgi:hypothetical protein